MAQKTGTETTMKREQLGEYLQDLGEQLAGEDEVTERSSLLRGNREKVSLDPNWKPTKKKK